MVLQKGLPRHGGGANRSGRPRLRLDSARKAVWVFVIASFIGYLLETVYCGVLCGRLVCRQGVIYGPFNQVYGIGALAMCATVLPVSNRSCVRVFCVGALTGGAIEFACSYLQELLFGTRSWDFSGRIASIEGRTSLFFMTLWGLLGCVFVKWIYPAIDRLLERSSLAGSKLACVLIVVFFLLDFTISGLAVGRWVERGQGIAPQHRVDTLCDRLYPDPVMEFVYPEMTLAHGAVL